MFIVNVGINYETAPIEIREKITFSSELESANRQLSQYSDIKENIILSTCNRTEIYVVLERLEEGYASVKKFLLDWFELRIEELEPYLIVHTGADAIRHLLQVITGLHSMVLGETQILGQIREAYLTSFHMNTTGKIFNEIFQRAIAFAKEAHVTSRIGEHTVSISYAAVELLKQSVENLPTKKILVVGAGEMGELAVRNLIALKCHHITILNRTYERAEKLAGEFSLQAEEMEDLENLMVEADIVFFATGSQSPLLSKVQVKAIQERRRHRPLVLVDIGLPRNIEDRIREVEQVTLYNIDDLQTVVDTNLEARRQAAEKVRRMIEEEMEAIEAWMKLLGADPIVTSLHQKGSSIHEEVYETICRKLPHLTEKERNVIYYQTRRIMRQLLHEPITKAKELAVKGELEENVSCFGEVFDLEKEFEAETKAHIDYYRTLLDTKKVKALDINVGERAKES